MAGSWGAGDSALNAKRHLEWPGIIFQFWTWNGVTEWHKAKSLEMGAKLLETGTKSPEMGSKLLEMGLI